MADLEDLGRARGCGGPYGPASSRGLPLSLSIQETAGAGRRGWTNDGGGGTTRQGRVVRRGQTRCTEVGRHRFDGAMHGCCS
ncbi:hypothetical protein BDA96_04G133200 [Sorghum bicolor]|uniref:Uncharacterized protein n=1 Tax=Sorghum bicolor TaxID=4558 RepID=A0A921R3Z9_SORBI|nr:hypothetical protein BDA96_04G133200 [Sorghum bicolor]